MDKLVDILEDGIKDLVMLLREYGFNTFCSCGCKPSPYVQMECYDDSEMTKLYNLLRENGYEKFELHLYWDSIANSRCLEVRFTSGVFKDDR